MTPTDEQVERVARAIGGMMGDYSAAGWIGAETHAMGLDRARAAIAAMPGLPAQGDPVSIWDECAEIAMEHVGGGPAGHADADIYRRIGYDQACRDIAEAIKLRASNRKTMDAIANAALLKP